ncbi:unnamed protein product [Protopolystoma xenopodis]|uniref:Uncharacterized protein n=1 Tax=Protopolystoma xenopodis TaxID=117903 RepID=A0A448WGK3_9PLAT|nr:unnamed protein product [Protopolystoma xenopodis]
MHRLTVMQTKFTEIQRALLMPPTSPGIQSNFLARRGGMGDALIFLGSSNSSTANTLSAGCLGTRSSRVALMHANRSTTNTLAISTPITTSAAVAGEGPAVLPQGPLPPSHLCALMAPTAVEAQHRLATRQSSPLSRPAALVSFSGATVSGGATYSSGLTGSTTATVGGGMGPLCPSNVGSISRGTLPCNLGLGFSSLSISGGMTSSETSSPAGVTSSGEYNFHNYS